MLQHSLYTADHDISVTLYLPLIASKLYLILHRYSLIISLENAFANGNFTLQLNEERIMIGEDLF